MDSGSDSMKPMSAAPNAMATSVSCFVGDHGNSLPVSKHSRQGQPSTEHPAVKTRTSRIASTFASSAGIRNSASCIIRHQSLFVRTIAPLTTSAPPAINQFTTRVISRGALIALVSGSSSSGLFIARAGERNRVSLLNGFAKHVYSAKLVREMLPVNGIHSRYSPVTEIK